MNKKFQVRSVEFQVHEDSWEHGEGKLMCIWTEENLPICDTIEEALSKVPDFDELIADDKRVWTNDPCSENDFSRFDADALVDFHVYSQVPLMHVSNNLKKKWKAGKAMLYNLHATAIVKVIMELTADDVKDFGNA